MSATLGTNGPAFMGTFTTSGNPIYRPAAMTPTQPSATPRTTALFERQDVDPQTTNQDRWEEMTDHARTLETELAEQRWLKECAIKQTGEVLAELARLRADFASVKTQTIRTKP